MRSYAMQALVLCALVGSGAIAAAQPASGNSRADATAGNLQKPGAPTALGDLTPFRAIAVDTLHIVDTGDLEAAKKRIKELELAWDQAEPKMKPRAPQKWDVVDVAVDRALKELRAWRSTQAGSREALQALIATIDSMK
jgi:hypothetical protein